MKRVAAGLGEDGTDQAALGGREHDFPQTIHETGAMAAVAAQGGCAAAQNKPNILWIYSDDHSHNAVSAYGSHLAEAAPAPNIDRIAKEGMIFRNSFAANSICGPCRVVILTGKHSHLNGFRRNGDRLRRDYKYPEDPGALAG